uniref:Uncharacterized protein n=1 Tax=Oryza brachyantha TaxID=4533 RepID=J3MSY5_ORYBR
MYVTRPISRYENNPQAAAGPPPEGPGSGILVVEGDEAVERAANCWGLCRDSEVRGLPLAQSRMAKVERTTEYLIAGDDDISSEAFVESDDVVFVPVIGLPLSSNRYYVVRAEGKHIGMVSACSKEEDKTTFCFYSRPKDVPARPFDHGDVYQQVELVQLKGGKGFRAEAVAADGIPPKYLRRKGWTIRTSSSTRYDNLTDSARGVDWPLRRRMPDLSGFGAGAKSSPPVVVGRWYCPFMFVRDGRRLKDQVRRCMFYEMTLEQSWEEIYSRDNVHQGGGGGTVSATVRRSTALLGGADAVQGGGPQAVDGVLWFRPASSRSASAELGLDMVLWERMKWELEKGGWVAAAGDGETKRIERVERRGGRDRWDRFSCYLLVERFVLRRTDGSVALTYDFRHTDKIRTLWS